MRNERKYKLMYEGREENIEKEEERRQKKGKRQEKKIK